MSEAGIACFGEILLRLGAPAGEMLIQSPTLTAHVGGAEANVAVSLAHFGHRCALISVLPDSALGRAAVAELRRHGVGTELIQFRPGRLGLYFLTAGAGVRSSEVLYDREASAFAQAPPDGVDWSRALTGMSWLHLSGITPAVSPNAAQAALRAARAARAQGVSVSFDCNYRAKLWQRWGADARPILRELIDEADLLFAEQRDIALIFDRHFDDEPPSERFKAAAAHALAMCGRLRRVATTVRIQHTADDHELSAILLSRAGLVTTRTYPLGRIVDRIGSGDAFAAGVLHAVHSGWEDQAVVDFGLAAACLKHSIAGDFNLVGVAEVHNLLRDAGFTVRR